MDITFDFYVSKVAMRDLCVHGKRQSFMLHDPKSAYVKAHKDDLEVVEVRFPTWNPMGRKVDGEKSMYVGGDIDK